MDIVVNRHVVLALLDLIEERRKDRNNCVYRNRRYIDTELAPCNDPAQIVQHVLNCLAQGIRRTDDEFAKAIVNMRLR